MAECRVRRGINVWMVVMVGFHTTLNNLQSNVSAAN